MKLIKKLLVALLVMLLVVGCAKDDPKTPNEGKDPVVTDPNKPEDPKPEDPKPTKDTLVVGSTGTLNGSFIGGFGQSAYDVWVRNLIHDYATYATDKGGQFKLNTTVVDGEPKITENADGSKTYQFKIKDGLKYNTGDPITAADFVFSILFGYSPEYKKVGSTTGSSAYLYVGGQEYLAGESKSMPGVKLVDKNTFELTISADELPYFYETSLVVVGPTPMHRYVPGVTIGDDGSSLKLAEGTELTDAQKATYVANMGTEIKNAEAAAAKSVEDWKAAVEKAEKDGKPKTADEIKKQEEAQAKLDKVVTDLKAALAAFEGGEVGDAVSSLMYSGALDVKNNYRFKPDVTTGPYQFRLFENGNATVELNPNYAGNFEGKKAVIPRVEVRYVQSAVDVDSVISGDIDIAPGVIEAAKITKALENKDKVSETHYNRNGFGLINFLTDMEPTVHKGVRQAVAYLMNRDDFVQNMTGGYGEVVNGEFGISQWQYVQKGKDFVAAIEARDTVYVLDTDKANEALDTTPYKFEADGVTPWDKAKAAAADQGDSFNYWRYNDKKEQLVINHLGASKEVIDIIANNLPKNGKLAGLQYITNFTENFNLLLDNYYDAGDLELKDRTYSAFSMGVGFYPDSLPFWSYHSSQIDGGGNYTRVNDPQADTLTSDMMKTDAKDINGFLDKWLAWQLWYNENLPQIPLYANQYFDIYTNQLEGLETTPDWTWAHDINNLKFK